MVYFCTILLDYIDGMMLVQSRECLRQQKRSTGEHQQCVRREHLILNEILEPMMANNLDEWPLGLSH